MKTHPTQLIRVDARYALWLKWRANRRDIPVTKLTRQIVLAALARAKAQEATP